MQRHYFTLCIGFLVSVAIGPNVWGVQDVDANPADGTDSVARPVPESLEGLGRWLASPVFMERKIAEEKLKSGGFESVELVAHLLNSGDQEVAWRAQRMLLYFFAEPAEEVIFRRIELILDLAIASGHDGLLSPAAATKKELSQIHARKLIAEIQGDEGVQITEYPSFPGRVIVVNGRVVESTPNSQQTPQIETDPTTLAGAAYAKENFDSLVDQIVKMPLDALTELATTLREKGIQLAVNDTAYGKVNFGFGVYISGDVTSETLGQLQELSSLVTQAQISLTDLDLTPERFNWLMSLARSEQMQVLSIAQCKVETEQLDQLSAELGDYFSVVGRAMIGIKGNPLVNSDGSFQGAIVTEVTAGSGADNAGIVRGDRIVRVNDKKVRDFEHLRHLVAAFAPDEEIELTVIRAGLEEPQPFEVKLTPYSN